MPISTMAVYKNGVLEPVDSLTLEEDERVRLTITQEPDTPTVHDELGERVEAWLVTQRPRPARGPLEFSAEERARLDSELDEIVKELHGRSEGISEAEVTDDVDEALEAARSA